MRRLQAIHGRNYNFLRVFTAMLMGVEIFWCSTVPAADQIPLKNNARWVALTEPRCSNGPERNLGNQVQEPRWFFG